MRYFGVKQYSKAFIHEGYLDAVVVGTMYNKVQTDP